MDFQQHLKHVSLLIEEKVPLLMPDTDLRLHEAMSYAVLTPGKRLRPFLTFVSSSLFGVSEESALRAALAIEFVHTYSLIHDDLPSMDNDDERRGFPSCHVKFGEAVAILAGDALLTLSFEIMSDNLTHPDSNVRCELISALAKAAGCQGLVGGQMLDMLQDKQVFSIHEIIRMQRMKTGELFAIACEAGAILGKASKNLRIALRGYAHALGLAFQIIDDITDRQQDAILPSGSKEKVTYVDSVGVEKSLEQAKMLINQAIVHLHVFEDKAEPLRQLAKFVISKHDPLYN